LLCSKVSSFSNVTRNASALTHSQTFPSTRSHSSFAVREDWEKERIVTLMCIDSVDKKYREIGDKDPNYSSNLINYGAYMCIDGVHSMTCRREQATFLDELSRDACLFYLAFTFVDGTDGIANGIGRNIMSYIGIRKSIYSPSAASAAVDVAANLDV
jgi:hypothetical protein